MIRRRHAQASLWDGWLAAEVADLWEPRMREIDEVLRDEPLLEAVYEAQGQRHPQSRRRGRHQTPAEVVLRMLLLQHVRNWSYETLERAVRDNLVYRSFCRIGREKVPDARAFVAFTPSRHRSPWETRSQKRCSITFALSINPACAASSRRSHGTR